MPETVIRSRIDSGIKQEAQALLERFGLTMSEAIRLFLHQVVLEKGLPFQVRLPEAEAAEYDRWFKNQVELAVREADSPGTTCASHDTVRGHWARKRKTLTRKAGKQQP